MATSPEPCPEPTRLRDLLEDRLAPDEQAALSGHLETCAHCQAAIERLAAESRWWDEARALQDEEVPASCGSADTRLEIEMESPAFPFLDPPKAPGYLGRFGPYDVIEFIGQGGSGMVFKAFDPALHRLVAIKVLAPQFAVSATARQRFFREARAAASICHDHVVTIHAVDEANSLPYLVMQYVAGKSLQERIDRTGPLELKEILRIGMQAASGLSAAHAQGLIHRDVKPSNILLENGIERVKLTDFGLARAVDDATLTQSGLIAGTPQYMSPEQAMGSAVDPRADQFGLGCVLYAMCTGHSPFRARTTMAVLRRVCDETQRPIRDGNPEIPVWFAAIVDRMLAKDPGHRYASCAEVASILAGHLARLQQPAVASGALTTTVHPRAASKPGRRLRRLAAAAVGLIVLCTASEVLGVTHVAKVLGTVLRIRTADGTLVLDVADPNTSILIDGQDVVITGAGPREIRLKPGVHQLLAIKDQNRDEALLTIDREGRRTASVILEPTNRPRITLDQSGATPPPTSIKKTVENKGAVAGAAPPRGPTLYVSDTDVMQAPPRAVAPAPVAVSGESVRTATLDLPDINVTQAPQASAPAGALQPAPDGPAIEPPPPAQPLPLVELRARGTILQLAYTPDGRYLLVLHAGGALASYDTQAPKLPPDGDRPASRGKGIGASFDGATPFTAELRLGDTSFQPGVFALSSDGKRLAASSSIGEVRIWDIAGRDLSRDAQLDNWGQLSAHKPYFGSNGSEAPRLCFSPDDKLLATAGQDGKVKLWDPAKGRLLLELPVDSTPAPVGSLAFSPDGKLLAVARQLRDANERGVQLWRIDAGDPPTARIVGVLNAGSVQGAATLVFAPKSELLFAYRPNDFLTVWDLANNLKRSAAGIPPTTSLACSADGKWVAMGIGYGMLSIRASDSSTERMSFRAGASMIMGVAFSPDGRTLATSTRGPSFDVRLWNVNDLIEPTSGQSQPKVPPSPRVPGAAPQDETAGRAVPAERGADDVTSIAGSRELARTLLEQAQNRLSKAQAEFPVSEAQAAEVKSAVAPLSVATGRARSRLERIRKLVASNAVSAAEVEQAQERLNDAEAAERSARVAARIAEARVLSVKAQIDEARVERELAQINLTMLEAREQGGRPSFSSIAKRGQARRALADARVESARADRMVAEANIQRAKSELLRAHATSEFRAIALKRTQVQAEKGAVSKSEVEETQELLDTALANEAAARAAVKTAEAQLKGADALLEQAVMARKKSDDPSDKPQDSRGSAPQQRP
jgi:WD40 repeat protein